MFTALTVGCEIRGQQAWTGFSAPTGYRSGIFESIGDAVPIAGQLVAFLVTTTRTRKKEPPASGSPHGVVPLDLLGASPLAEHLAIVSERLTATCSVGAGGSDYSKGSHFDRHLGQRRGPHQSLAGWRHCTTSTGCPA